MLRMIGIVNMSDGRIAELASDTPTLDVPADFIRPDGIVTLDAESNGHYIASDGKSRAYFAFVRPLSWRAHGEECLVVQRSGRRPSMGGRNLYRLVSIESLS